MNKTNKYLLIPLGLLSMTALSGVLLMSSDVNADNTDVVDEINITVPVSCTLSGSGMTSHTASIPNGTYTPDIGTTTLTAFCNDNAGFSIYAAGYTGDEIGGTNSTKLVGTSASNNATIDTGTATGPVSGNDTSNWAMKLTALSNPTPTYPITITSDTSGSFSSYHAVPNEYTKVATRTSGTDIGQSAEGSTLTTTYAAYISKTQAADTYSGQVIYTLVHPYDAANPGAISIEDAYAKNGKQKYNGYYKMQEMSDSICSIVTLYDEESQTQLIDIRDDKTYYVAKLQDGNCWMTQNLDHDIVTTPNYYTNENTDIGYNSSTQSYNTTTWTAEHATHTSSNTYWCDEYDENYNCSSTAIASYDPGELYWNGTAGYYASESACTDAGGTWDRDNITCNQISSTGNPHYHLGNYYNWSAAVAINDNSSIEEGTVVDRSICPTGWTLPRPGTGANSFSDLLDNYGLTATFGSDISSIWDSPLYFGLLGGNNYDSRTSITNVGYHGIYWTPYLVSHYYTTVLDLFQDTLSPGNWDSVDGGTTANGISIRCLARPVTNTIEGLE